MHLKHFKNFDLWKKTQTMTESINELESRNNSSFFPLTSQIKDLIKTINTDIHEACSNDDLHITLYHFSKAKSSCLILTELLNTNEISANMELNSFLLQSNTEMISMLNNYIHLNRINIIISIRRKKK